MDFGLATRQGRALLADDHRGLDIETASQGRFSADAMQILRRWDEFLDWAAGTALRSGEPLDPAQLGPCVPQPQKIFGIGLNYRDHAEEAGLPIPDEPLVFTKFPNCLSGPRAEIPLGGSDRVDFEAELVVAIGRGGLDIPAARALDHVAGYCVGQDISDRRVQFAGKPPQFSLGQVARLAEVTGARVIVDSSKKPLYAVLLESSPGIDLRILHLVRDPRGVAWSWQKQKHQPGRGGGTPMRRHGPVVSAARWVLRNTIVERRWGGDPRGYLRLGYETMMADPRAAIARIVQWLGEQGSPDPFVSSHTVRLRPNHTVWGNPSRFDTGEVLLQLDDAWRRELAPARRRIVTWLTGPWLARYGYSR